MSREDDSRAVVRQVLAATPGFEDLPADDRHDNAPRTVADPGPALAAAKATVAFGADHGGFALKGVLIESVRALGYAVRDCGTDSTEAVDYPDLAHKVARQVATGSCRWGIIIDGAGIGSAMTANKVPGVRAALCYDLSSARNSREHNLANVLTLGAGLIGSGLAKQIVQTWLETPWGGDRHARRVALITEVEQRYLRRNA